MKSLVSIVFAAAVLQAGQAAAQCATVEPVLAPQLRLDPMDASGAAQLAQPLVLMFRRAEPGSAPLQIRYQIVDEDSALVSRIGVTAGPQVEWQAGDSARDIGAFRSEAYPLLRVGRVVLGEDDQAAQASLIMRLVNLNADLSAGVYREQFTVRYWCGAEDALSLPFEAQGVVATSVVVPNVISASIAGASAQGEIDFMDFALTSRRVQVSVRSTGPYRVSARSQNGGVLLRQGIRGAGDTSDRIGYEARLDDQVLRLDGGESFRVDRAGLAGRLSALEIQVASTQSKRAGEYRDTVFLTLTPAI